MRYAVYLSNRYILTVPAGQGHRFNSRSGARREIAPGYGAGRSQRSAKAREFITHAWKSAILLRMNRKKHVSIPKKSAKEKETLRRPARPLQAGRRHFRRGHPRGHRRSRFPLDRVAVTSIKEDEQQKLLRIEPELHSASSVRIEPSPHWLAPFGAAALG